MEKVQNYQIIYLNQSLNIKKIDNYCKGPCLLSNIRPSQLGTISTRYHDYLVPCILGTMSTRQVKISSKSGTLILADFLKFCFFMTFLPLSKLYYY